MTWESIASASTALAVIVAIISFIFESRRSRAINEIQLLTGLDQQFCSAGFCKKRRLAAEHLCQTTKTDAVNEDWDVVSDVLDFFQVLGTTVKHGHIRTELVYKYFFYWFSNYWIAGLPYVKYVQQNSRITYGDAHWLYQKLASYDQKHNAGALVNQSENERIEFLQWEVHNNCEPTSV